MASLIPSEMLTDLVTIYRLSAGTQTSTGDYSCGYVLVVSATPANVQPYSSSFPVLKAGVEFINTHRMFMNKTSAFSVQANDLVTVISSGERFVVTDPDDYNQFINHYEAKMTTYAGN